MLLDANHPGSTPVSLPSAEPLPVAPAIFHACGRAHRLRSTVSTWKAIVHH
jgi:hypothetical protein